MELKQCILICLTFILLQTRYTQGEWNNCEIQRQPSGIISYSRNDYTTTYNPWGSYTTTYNPWRYYTTPRTFYTRDYYRSTTQPDFSKCWYISLPEENYLTLDVIENHSTDPYCDYKYLEVIEERTSEKHKICSSQNAKNWTKNTLSSVRINFQHRLVYWQKASFSIKMKYHIESVACLWKNNFRCSENHCISSKKVCDGQRDCKDGSDEHECGPLAIDGIKQSRENALNWLKMRQADFGWGRNTHRAITALYLTEAAEFRGSQIEEEAIIKELELKLAITLLRNATDPLTANELSMYLNALSVTCHDYRSIFGRDLLKILANRAFSSPSPSPGAYLTLCNANWTLSKSNLRQLLDLLSRDSEYPFVFEIQAMTIMALSCIRHQRTDLFRSLNNATGNATDIYFETIDNFMSHQESDGSFGNIHTTAMVTQALFSSGEANNTLWNSRNAMRFLMENLNSSSSDFLSVYLTLPLLRGKTLVDIGSIDCSKYKRRPGEDDDILDVTDTLEGNVHVQLSLYIGEHKNVIHTIYLRVPDNSTFYDVMKVAKVADHKYEFSYHKLHDHVYIYEIAGITNDMEAGKYWQFFKAYPQKILGLRKFTASPDEIIVENNEHLILWYKSVDI